jgi:murein DD-endopeptidase MepM/ murein hydrolase activator NlpD
MKKGLSLVFLFFCSVVVINFFLAQLNSLHLSFSFVPLQTTRASNELSAIDFSFFGKNGTGESYITQGYGVTPYSYLYVNHWHDGIDIAAASGAPIYSATAGTVLATGDQDDYCYHLGFGKYVAVKDSSHGLVLWYAHLGTITVSPDATVSKGAELGTVGTTGYETGTHLHFSIFDENGFSMENRNGCGPDPTGKDLDPIPFLQTL